MPALEQLINFGSVPDEVQLDMAARAGGITEMQNPITRSMVRIEPPLICTNLGRFKQFETYFWNWCEALWQINRIDPAVLATEHDWLLSDQYAMFTRDLTGQG